jgi:hypothetical protein
VKELNKKEKEVLKDEEKDLVKERIESLQYSLVAKGY